MPGTPFRLHVSWVFLLPLIALTLACVVFPTLVPELSNAAYWWMALAGTLGVVFSVLLRELVLACMRSLSRTPSARVTLSVLGGAWQLHDHDLSASKEAWLAVLGLATSFAVSAGLFMIVFGAATNSTPLAVSGVLFFLALANAGLAAISLVPVYPLGSGRLLQAVLARHRSAARAGRISAMLAMFIGIAVAASGAIVVARGAPVWGAWLALLGAIVSSFAGSAYRDETGRRAGSGST